MSFRVRTAIEILSKMTSYIKHTTDKLTDFRIGSVTRTLLEAVSLEVEELYLKMYDGFLWAIENSIFKAFGFTRKEATKATGMLTIEFVQPLTSPFLIPINTKFCTSSPLIETKYYVSTENIIVPLGLKKIDIPIEAVALGKRGNAVENTINVMITSNTIVNRVYNSKALTNGMEKESLIDCKNRFINYISTLSRGTTEAIEYGISCVEGVKSVWVDDKNVGFVKIYAGNSNGELPSPLKTEVQNAANKYKAAGIGAEVYSFTKEYIDVSLVVYLNAGYDVEVYKDLITDSIKNYFNTFQAGQSFYIIKFSQQVVSIDNLAIITLKLNAPMDDRIVSKAQIIRLRELTVEIVQDTI